MQYNVNILLCVALSCMGLVSGKPSDGYAAAIPTYSQPMSYEQPTYAEPSYDVQDVVSNSPSNTVHKNGIVTVECY